MTFFKCSQFLQVNLGLIRFGLLNTFMMEKVKTKISQEKQHQKMNLLATLKKANQKLNTSFLYLEERAHQIVTSFLNESEIFSTGFTKIINKNNILEEEIQRVVITAVMGQFAMNEMEKFFHLFEQILIINLTISGKETKEQIRVSPLKKKLKGFFEISLNFMPFIDSVYFISSIINKQTQNSNHLNFEEALTSFLLSLPKYHQFRFSFLDNNPLGTSIKNLLEKKLAVMQEYKVQSYSSHSSPKLKILVLQRKLDQMSPLLYSYHFGPISQELGVFDDKSTQFTTDSVLYTAMYPMDIEQASLFLQAIAQDKAQNQKTKFQLHEFQKAKKIINKHYDQHTSPEEIQMQIEALNSVKEFCQKRIFTTTLQQTIINACSEGAEKMTPGKVVDRIVEWQSFQTESYKPSQEDYIKILILSYMVNNFWFWHRRIINADLDPARKQKVLAFCKKVEGKFKPLNEKTQGEDRLDLYRHQPSIVEAARRWMIKDQSQRYVEININESPVNRESVYIIAIKGPLGYGELALLIKQLRQNDEKSQYIFFCSSLVTTKEYLNYLLEDEKLP